MAAIRFDVEVGFDAPPEVVWDELTDWEGHATWVPLTRVEVGPGEPTAIGATFTAWTGLRPIRLEDRMRVARLAWDADARRGECEVEKLGPLLAGRAAFTVECNGACGSLVVWTEDVTVRRLPTPLARMATPIAAAGFRFAMRRLARRLGRSSSPTPDADRTSGA